MFGMLKRKISYHSRMMKPVVKNLFTGWKHTFCPYLWDSVFIDDRGNVFTCCHSMPCKIGNIYQQSMTDIWQKSMPLKLVRGLSRSKCLACYFPCNILTNEHKAAPAGKPAKLRHPRRVWLLVGEFCNINCIMCSQNHLSQRVLDNEIVKKHIDWSQVEEIELQGGEVLALKKARELYLWLTQEMGKKVNLISNGMLIDDEWAVHLAKGSGWIEISVNAATAKMHEAVNRKSNFERVTTNIRKLVAAKKKYQTDVEIIYKFTMTEEAMHEIADAILVADELGCDTITYGYEKDVVAALRENKALSDKLSEQVKDVLKRDLRVNVNLNRLEYLGLM